MVWWGVGATEGVESSIELLMDDPDEDVRAEAALALYEAGKGSAKENAVREAFRRAAQCDASDYVRDSALAYLEKLDQQRT
jgi:HEAT repeat protein